MMVTAWTLACVGFLTADPAPTPDRFFAKEIRPILAGTCWKCHGGEGKPRGGLDLTSREGLLRGGNHGPAVTPQKPESSLLLEMIGHGDSRHRMPPAGKLPETSIAALRRWVELGAPWSEKDVAQPLGRETKSFTSDVTASGKEPRGWWAYQPLTRPAPPPVEDAAWARGPIDHFILEKLSLKGLRPAPAAGRAAILRRLSYDLTGLPPTISEIERFVANDAPDAHEREVERLLGSPHFGEKWARHWLDLVRYAETNGYERDRAKPHVWRYRDYIIGSFNKDKPYDQFLREQLAGDESEPVTGETIIATGFYRLGVWDDDTPDRLQARFDELDDILSTTSQVFLATTINCARCHDHKADPIPQADYYRLLAFFLDIERYGTARHMLTDISSLLRTSDENRRLEKLSEEKSSLEAKKIAIEDAVIRRMPAEDQRRAEGPERPRVIAEKLPLVISVEERAPYDALLGRLAELEKALSVLGDLVLSVNHSNPSPAKTHILLRGNPNAEGQEVSPGFPAALASQPGEPLSFQPLERSAGRRRVLADWIASPHNPVTARVIVNRLWQHHFGRGLVRTPNDFGRLGEVPTHPELLDWLASKLIAGEWSLKAIHRDIVTSSAYRMSTATSREALAKDPTNDLLSRFNPRRLMAEEIRDSILELSGSLNRRLGGPSVYTEVPIEVLSTASQPHKAWGRSEPADRDRRSVYIVIKRSLIEPVLGTFDLPDPDSSCAARFQTTVPTQSLTSLNGEFFGREARRFAARLRKEAPGNSPAQVALALELALARRATPKEVEQGVGLLRDWSEADHLDPEKALENFALLVLNLNEFLYLD